MIQLLLLFFCAAFAAPHMRTGFVTDEPGFIGADTRAGLEDTVAEFSDRTGFDLAVLVVASIGGVKPCEYATTVRKDWQLGGSDGNGVLYLVVPPPEKQACIVTGRGARVYLSDATAVSIIDTVAKPLNLQDRRVEAIEAATAAIIQTLGPMPIADRAALPKPAQPYVDRGTTTSQEPTNSEMIFWTVIFIAVVLAVVWLVWMSSQNRRGYGGGYSSSSSSYFFLDTSSGYDSGGSSDSGGDGGGGGGGDSG